ncbi:MAG: hypothetical protein J5720_04265 [Bacteroidaceae bacterium]|nr:hypothetical protein [Bacteroidaceae bacterium]
MMIRNKINKGMVLLLMSLNLISCASNDKKSEENKGYAIEYRVVESASGDIDGEELWATKDGQFQNTGIGDVVCWIIDQRDYDGDGLEEAFIGESSGGSASWSSIVFYDKESNTFRKVEFRNLDVSLNDSVEEWNGKWSFTGGNESHNERFIFEGGRIMKVESYTRPKPEGAETLLTLSPSKMFGSEMEAETGDKKTTSYDLDGDGKNEIIECEYMHGILWGDPERDRKPTMHITIYWSKGSASDLTGEEYWLEMNVLSTKTNGVNDLTNGQKGVTYRWDGRQYKQQ